MNGGGFNPSLLVIDAIQREWGGCNPSPLFSTPFEVKGEGSPPPPLFDVRLCSLFHFYSFLLTFSVLATATHPTPLHSSTHEPKMCLTIHFRPFLWCSAPSLGLP